MSNATNDVIDEKAKEKRIMVMMRQVLSAVARDTVPPPGMKHPLSDSTIQGIRDALALITSREHELNIELDEVNDKRPRFVDEPETTKVVSLDSITK
ncbi:MAG: segregation and condensation protein A [Gammaproteobacteria bacterium]|nr:segregation and condensation protein A [Gammaproteobacteria bacterium]